jgi:uncharacterized protein
MTLEQWVRTRRDEILAAARRNGATNIRLFGSVARGEADEASDIDILCDMESGRSLLDLARFRSELESVLGRPVDVVTERGLRERVKGNILSEAALL